MSSASAAWTVLHDGVKEATVTVATIGCQPGCRASFAGKTGEKRLSSVRLLDGGIHEEADCSRRRARVRCPFTDRGGPSTAPETGGLGHRGREARRQPVRPQGARGRGRRQHVGARHCERRDGRRHQESRLGSTAAREDQNAHPQAGDDDHQYAYARRSRERKRRIPRHRGCRRSGEHKGQHGGDAAAVIHGAAGRWPAAEHLHAGTTGPGWPSARSRTR